MMSASEALVHVFHDGVVDSLARSSARSGSCFGGPLEQEVTGLACGPRGLHHVASLSHLEILCLGPPGFVLDLPLVFGLCYSGCVLKYEVHPGSIVLVELEPLRSSAGWPYPSYPDLLPFAPLEVGARRQQSWNEFAEAVPGLPRRQPSDLVAVVPPPMTLGLSLWGRHGDAEGVALVFECDLVARTVVAYTVCT